MEVVGVAVGDDKLFVLCGFGFGIPWCVGWSAGGCKDHASHSHITLILFQYFSHYDYILYIIFVFFLFDIVYKSSIACVPPACIKTKLTF